METDSLADSYRVAGVYFPEFSKVKSPPTCPPRKALKVELCISLKIAKALGIVTVPFVVSGRADGVIE